MTKCARMAHLVVSRCRGAGVLALICLLAASPLSAQEVSTQGKPTVMVVLQEKVMGVLGTTGWEVPTQAELTLMEKIQEQGFPVVDPATVRRNIVQSKGLRMLEADNLGAAAVGLQHGAQISILGTAISKPAGAKLFETQMQSIQATVTARVIQNDTGKIIATGSATSAVAHIDEVRGGALALEEATQELAAELVPKLVAATDSREGAPRMITLNITGLKSYRHLDYILYFFEEKVTGIAEVYLRDFSNSVAEVSLMYADQSAVLARIVAKEKFRGFRLEPTNVTENRIDISAIGND